MWLTFHNAKFTDQRKSDVRKKIFRVWFNYQFDNESLILFIYLT